MDSLLGSTLFLSATALGWALGRRRNMVVVRAVSWWMHTVVVPLVSCRLWTQRALVIVTNNALVLAAVVALGVRPVGAALAVGVVGLALGIGLRALSEFTPHWSAPGPNCPAEVRRQVKVGVALNLLELPAVALAVGLSIGRSRLPLSDADIWWAYGVWVVPLLVFAAGGEALWLGAGIRTGGQTGFSDSENPCSPINQ